MEISGITAYSRNAAQQEVMQEVGVRMLSSAMDQIRQAGEQLENIIQESGAIQISQPGAGRLIDTQA